MKLMEVSGKCVQHVRENRRDYTLWLALISAVTTIAIHWLDINAQREKRERALQWRLGDYQTQYQQQAVTPKEKK